MAQNRDEAEIGAVVDEMYGMISGPAGPRDWRIQARIFHPDARQMRTGGDDESASWIKIMSLDEYARDTEGFFAKNSFYEVELSRSIHVFGRMAHVWSQYEARLSPGDIEPERRGINSIQLYKGADGRWSIVSMIWDNERAPALA